MNYLVVITALGKSNFTNRIEPCFSNNNNPVVFQGSQQSSTLWCRPWESAHADLLTKVVLECWSAFVFHKTRTFNFLKLNIQLFFFLPLYKIHLRQRSSMEIKVTWCLHGAPVAISIKLTNKILYPKLCSLRHALVHRTTSTSKSTLWRHSAQFWWRETRAKGILGLP